MMYDGEAQSWQRQPRKTAKSRTGAWAAAAALTAGSLLVVLSSSSSGFSAGLANAEPKSAHQQAQQANHQIKRDYVPIIKRQATITAAPSGGAGAGAAGPGSAAPTATSGGSGSTITMANGQTFVYTNNFGGTWASEEGDFSARAQARSPALNETWDFNNYQTHGVNLGGWLVTEPFIVPNLYIPYQNSTPQAVDEYTLSQALGDDLAEFMTNHYETFITEEDFAQIAAAGMNWIRLPVPFWAVQTIDSEPFLEGVAFNYMLQAFEWARKYGLRVELDLHTVPGSQNGLNHSGRIGQGVGFMNGVMGIVNAQRTLNVIRVLTETISRPEYRHVMLFNVVNEAYVSTIGMQAIGQFYLECYELMRNITGIGAGNGPFMVIHDGFIGLSEWTGFLSGADRLSIESHYYFAFSPDNFGESMYNYVTRPCQWWAPGFNTSTNTFGLTIGGEWSLATNDCGLWLNAVGEGAYYDGSHSNSNGRSYGSCTPFTDVTQFSNTFKQQLRDFTLANMDTFQNFMFWTWKTQRNNATGLPYNPLWCYSCGLEYDYVPTDPAAAAGACNRLGPSYGGGFLTRVPITSTYSASQTGGTGTTSSISAAQTSQYGQWPPNSLTNIPNASNLPYYTATGPVPSYPTEPPTPLSVATTGPATAENFYTAVAGCSYLGPYQGVGAQVPNSRCRGNAPAATPTSQSFGLAQTTNIVATPLASPTTASGF